MTEKDRAKSIFGVANAYATAAIYLNQQAGKISPNLFIPSQVNAALALELYFKALYYIHFLKDFKINNRHSHDFHALFLQLPNAIRNEMEMSFSEILQKRNMDDVKTIEKVSKLSIQCDLEGNLRSWSSVFVKMRYMYDKPQEPITMMFFPEIKDVVVAEILAQQPNIAA